MTYVVRKLPSEPMLLAAGPHGVPDRRNVELGGRVRYDRFERPYLMYKGRPYPVISGGSLGSALPARMAESTGATTYVATTGNDTTGNGTSGNPYRTINKGVTQVADGGIVQIAAGDYTDQEINYPGWTARACTNPTTIQGQPWTWPAEPSVIVKAAALVGANTNWRLRNIMLDSIGGNDFTGFTLYFDDVNTPRVFEIDHCVIKRGGQGIMSKAAGMTNLQIWNSVLHHNGWERAITQQAITLTGSGQSLQVDSLQVATDYVPPADLWLPDHTLMHYTGTLTAPNRLTGCTGAGSWPSGTILFERGNSEPARASHGSYFNRDAHVNTPNVLVANCIYYDNEGNGIQIWANGSTNTIWVVNCVSAFNFNGSGFLYGSQNTNEVTASRFVNCISYKNGDYGFSGFVNPATTNSAGNANYASHCLAYLNGSVWGSANFSPSVANTFLLDNNNEADPLFVDPANRNFHLGAGSPAIGAADPSYCPPLDFDGVTRG